VAGFRMTRVPLPKVPTALCTEKCRIEITRRFIREGSAYLNATAFRYLGENFTTLRVVLFAFFVLWVPTFYWIASRLVSDWVAGGATLLAVAWSLPNYSAAVPSWYNLFFATFGLAAIWMYLAKNSTLWLFLAGLSGGLSFLAKNGALFYVAAVLLFILFREQELSRSTMRGREGRSVAYSAFLGLSMMVFSSLLVFLIRPHASAERLLEFVAPSAALAAVVLVREANGARAPSRQRFAMLASMCVPFLLGFSCRCCSFSFCMCAEVGKTLS